MKRSPFAASFSWRRAMEWGVSLLAGLLGLKLGYDFGLGLAGAWLGVIMGINAGLFGALAASMATDWLFRRPAPRHQTAEPPASDAEHTHPKPEVRP